MILKSFLSKARIKKNIIWDAIVSFSTKLKFFNHKNRKDNCNHKDLF